MAFGSDKYSLPLTLQGGAMMEGDIKAIKVGFMALLPVKDERGRAIIYADVELQKALALSPEQVSIVYIIMRTHPPSSECSLCVLA